MRACGSEHGPGRHHLAEQVRPPVQRLQQNKARTTEPLDKRDAELRERTDERRATLRRSMPENPLVALRSALTLGLLGAQR